jgi:hypothetical protein
MLDEAEGRHLSQNGQFELPPDQKDTNEQTVL